MQEIEIEFKNILTYNEYTNLVNDFFQKEEPIRQVNYYFETSDFQLRDNLAALRIRKKDETYVATLKQPHSNGLLETHDSVSEDTLQNWMKNVITLPPNIKEQLDEFGIQSSDLRYAGSLQTERLEKKKEHTILVLDHSTYNDMEDYELELEATNASLGKQTFKQLLKEYNIEERPTKNKIERFFNSVSFNQ
ncbi:CYTH domain-containing protein [Halalkalibacillus halophilus]|uniref:CYTH domain-containing protein n=1 Tax=Halalkalibacillus halophilus TaxID=392827 RepID=UPI0004272C32|nr:CYTH domain-containing protein [Halalkalibacillus halophilus]